MIGQWRNGRGNIVVIFWICISGQNGAATELNARASAAALANPFHAVAAASGALVQATPAADGQQSSPASAAPKASETPAPTQPKALEGIEGKSRSILQMVEGRETEIQIGLIVAAIAFLLGWLCGSSYYARRERKSRYKLRF